MSLIHPKTGSLLGTLDLALISLIAAAPHESPCLGSPRLVARGRPFLEGATETAPTKSPGRLASRLRLAVGNGRAGAHDRHELYLRS